MRALDLLHARFGRLTVTEPAGSAGGKRRWLCICDCGGSKIVVAGALRDGTTKSCGCIQREMLHARNKPKHGWSRHKLYGVWRAMMRRCYDEGDPKYADYGGRGIVVDPRWHSLVRFCEDNISSWAEGLQLDRKDNDGPYSPGNTRWVTRTVNMRNRRSSRHVVLNGRRVTLAEFQELTGWKLASSPGAARLVIVTQ